MTMEKMQVVKELHTPARKVYPRRKYYVKKIDQTWSLDLIDLPNLKKYNKNHAFILVAIDMFSKFCFAKPLKTKKSEEVGKAFENILLESNRTPQNIVSDLGGEFYGSPFQKLMGKYGINHYSVFSTVKASHSERQILNLKRKLWIKMNFEGNYRWINYLDEIVDNYNSSKHTRIHIAPKHVTKDNEREIYHKYFDHDRIERFKTPRKFKFAKGQYVRVSRQKLVFEKSYTQNFSNEVFRINRVLPTNPVSYELIDFDENIIRGTFLNQELLATKYPNIFLIERVLKRKKEKFLWNILGYLNLKNDSGFNQTN